uniref:protein-serine/threonine phosphatase n=1 Tax=Strigamia maritima TaxID=126957 RepID=T1IXQ3_STRMM
MYSISLLLRNGSLTKTLKTNIKHRNVIRSYSRALYDPENKGNRQKHINFDTLGTWDNRIELPLLLQESIKRGKPIPKISVGNVGSASLIGRRSANEDRIQIKEISPDILYLAVFDGHGGNDCADFCSERLQDHICFWLNRGETDLKTILFTSFVEVNNAYSRFVTYNRTKTTLSGTTATVCLLQNSIELVVGHVGDSRAILCRNGEARKLTTDHSPLLKTEKERIVQSKGMVVTDSYGRSLVNGRLAMTRSLGDLDLKPYGVSAMPDTRSLQVQHGKDAFLVLTTDGINFVMSDQEICDGICRHHDPQEAANFITDQALQFASEDNSSAVIVPFGSWGKFASSTHSFHFGRSMIRSSRYV